MRDIGVWFDVMQGMVLTAILTNCLILGFSSEQLMQWLPWLYSRDTADGGDQILAVGSGRSGEEEGGSLTRESLACEIRQELGTSIEATPIVWTKA